MVVGGRAQKRYTHQRYDQTKTKYLRSSRGASREHQTTNPQTGSGRSRRHHRRRADLDHSAPQPAQKFTLAQVSGVDQNPASAGRAPCTVATRPVPSVTACTATSWHWASKIWSSNRCVWMSAHRGQPRQERRQGTGVSGWIGMWRATPTRWPRCACPRLNRSKSGRKPAAGTTPPRSPARGGSRSRVAVDPRATGTGRLVGRTALGRSSNADFRCGW